MSSRCERLLNVNNQDKNPEPCQIVLNDSWIFQPPGYESWTMSSRSERLLNVNNQDTNPEPCQIVLNDSWIFQPLGYESRSPSNGPERLLPFHQLGLDLGRGRREDLVGPRARQVAQELGPQVASPVGHVAVTGRAGANGQLHLLDDLFHLVTCSPHAVPDLGHGCVKVFLAVVFLDVGRSLRPRLLVPVDVGVGRSNGGPEISQRRKARGFFVPQKKNKY